MTPANRFLASMVCLGAFACAHARPANFPAQPASAPSSEPAVPELPRDLFTTLNPGQINGPQVITRYGLEQLANRVIMQRASADKKLADCGAREKTALAERDAAQAEERKSSWLPVLTGVLGVAVTAAVETLIVWAVRH